MEHTNRTDMSAHLPEENQHQQDRLHRFPTGAVRSCEADNERWDLIPFIGLLRLARTCAEGARRYGVGNWLRGIPIENLLDHAIRHLFFYIAGDRSEDHLAHAAWNILAACHMEVVMLDLEKLILQIPDDHVLWQILRGHGEARHLSEAPLYWLRNSEVPWSNNSL